MRRRGLAPRRRIFFLGAKCTAIVPDKAHGTADRRVGRAVPVTPLRGVTGEPHAGNAAVSGGSQEVYFDRIEGIDRFECFDSLDSLD